MNKYLTWFIKLSGVLLILIGLVGVYYGPLEIYVFYFFSDGGQFQYDGFGIGSLWFAYLVIQNLGYYTVAAIALPLGIGHLRRKRWTLPLIKLLGWFWLGIGLLLLGNLIYLMPSARQLDLDSQVLASRLTAIGIISVFLLIILPTFVLWFYSRPHVRSIFSEPERPAYWIEQFPFPLLAVLLFELITIIILHIAMFFQAAFPLFGVLMLGRQSAYIIAACVVIVVVLIYGTVRLRPWAWWGSVLFYSLLGISSVMTFARFTLYELAMMLNPPAYEVALIDSISIVHDFRLVSLIFIPLLLVSSLVITSRGYFYHHHQNSELI